MDTKDLPASTPDGRPDPTQYIPSLGHFDFRESRTPEEQLAASLRESARRNGRRTRWWETANGHS